MAAAQDFAVTQSQLSISSVFPETEAISRPKKLADTRPKMRGHGLAQRLKALNLESGLETTAPNPTRPKSPSKSPSKRASRASAKPYDLPSASGPGGLVSMLSKLREIRSENIKSCQKDDSDHDSMEADEFFDAQETFTRLKAATCNNNYLKDDE